MSGFGGFDMYGWRRGFVASELGKNARSVAHALGVRMKNGSCYPGLDSIQGDTRLSRNTVLAAIAELVEARWLVVIRRERRQSNIYLAAFPGGAVAELPPGLTDGSVAEPELKSPSRTDEASEQQPSRDTSRGSANGSKSVPKVGLNADVPAASFTAAEEAQLNRFWDETKK